MALPLASIAVLACAREPLAEICPDVDEGELVISELRADQNIQNSPDSFGHYIEIYNASGRDLDLQGLWVRQEGFNADRSDVFIRESIEIGAGDYFVVGPGLADDLSSWVNYGIGWDLASDGATNLPLDVIRYPSGSFLRLEACGELIDEVAYAKVPLTQGPLPELGSLACGNADNPPSADANDLAAEGCWCIDELPDDQDLFGLGFPGSPGEVNRCP